MENSNWNGSTESYHNDGGGRNRGGRGGSNMDSNGYWQNNNRGFRSGDHRHSNEHYPERFLKFRDPQLTLAQLRRLAKINRRQEKKNNNKRMNREYKQKKLQNQRNRERNQSNWIDKELGMLNNAPRSIYFHDTVGTDASAEPTALTKDNSETSAVSQVPEISAPKIVTERERINSVNNAEDTSFTHSSSTKLIAEEHTKSQKPVTETNALPLINAINIKKEKKDEPVTAANCEESSSGSSDESYEAGEVVKAEKLTKSNSSIATTPKSQKKAASYTKSSSSEDDTSSDDSVSSVKKKSPAKEKSTKSTKKLKKASSEDDVVCIGKQTNKYTIPDDDVDDSESGDQETESKKNKSKLDGTHPCLICDKKGHTSFQCQMICKNCSAPYHNLKTCPNPPNLNIALQTFIEFTSRQIAVFNIDQRFMFPTGVVNASAIPAMATLPANIKTKKEKRATKKSKKATKKKIKEVNSDDDDDDDDEEAEVEGSSDVDSSETESSDEPKQKRKRSAKQTATTTTMQPQPYQFPILAATSPYNNLMYPYGAPFAFTK